MSEGALGNQAKIDPACSILDSLRLSGDSQVMSFDPNAAASSDGIFGLPQTEKESALVLIPLPWEATTSYGAGTKSGPQAILDASAQVDLFDLDFGRVYEPGIFLRPEDPKILRLNDEALAAVKKHRAASAKGNGHEPSLQRANELGEELNRSVHASVESIFSAGKIPGLLGGDHSVPFGAFEAAAIRHPGLGLLHFDAHSDTRLAYEGFTWSHASILRNAMDRIPGISKLVQVGIRDFCEDEYDYLRTLGPRAHVFFDAHLNDALHGGEPWAKIAAKIAAALPKEVWITFDIDGMDPRFCPNTGTPVPGGLDFHQVRTILLEVVRSGRKIIGFDLNEVAPSPDGKDEWDANVGARILYKLCGATLASQGLIPLMKE